ncbi:hypothetical protein QVD17_38411 [Tagetes erecta]|uniref:Uncharacterized protein n=1 Tax=Tagetes erecta TaxID=13708 RepID=A0AAD8NG81_TARER|nr:hypothetical protein QVD17_38411 [Tagetes erecta]
MSKENQSAFEINGNKTCMIIAIVVLLAFEVTSVTLLHAMRDTYYTIFRYITPSLGCLVSVSLMMVLDLFPKENKMTYACLLSYGLFGYYMCTEDDHKKLDESCSDCFVFSYLGLVLVPLTLLLVLFVPINLNWIAYAAIYLSNVVEVMGVMFSGIIIFNQEQKAQNLKARHEQDKKNDDFEA